MLSAKNQSNENIYTFSSISTARKKKKLKLSKNILKNNIIICHSYCYLLNIYTYNNK